MSYRLKKNEDVQSGIQRIAVEQIDKARAELASETHVEAVHQLRKRCKKIRAALRLARPALGTRFKQENARFRDLAREVADLRDSQVLVETFDALMNAQDDAIDRRHYAPMRPKLMACREAASQGDIDERLGRIDQALEQARAEVAQWSLDTNGFDAVRGGLGKSYRRGLEAMRDAQRSGSVADYHEWRKRVKYHRYHCEILRRIWPVAMAMRAEALHHLSDLLGHDHDMAVLKERLTESPGAFGHRDNEQALVALIDERQDALRAAARPLGLRLFAEKPKALVRRFGVYWRAA